MSQLLHRFVGIVAPVLFAIPCITACGGGGGGGNSGPGAGAASSESDVIVTDASVDELETFTTRLQSIALVSSNGDVGSNLLSAPVDIDLIGAGTAPRWVAREALSSGVYRGVQVILAGNSTGAIARSGAPVIVNVLGSTFEFPFPSTAAFASGTYQQIVLDIDLVSSLDGSVTSPPLNFQPTGTASITAGGGASSPIDEVNGTVTSIDSSNDRMVIDAFSDGDATVHLGSVRIDITGNTLILDHGTVVTSTDAFLAAVVPNTSVIAVHGRMSGGRIVALRIERDDGTSGPAVVVRLDGRIRALDKGAGTLELDVLEIEQGVNLAAPVLAGGTTIDVDFEQSLLIVRDENSVTTPADLAVGQRVKVKFAIFGTAPFDATQIEIEAEPEFEGRITSTASGSINTFTIRLQSGEPAITAGLVTDTTTPVTVNVEGSTIVLGTAADPALSASQVLTGMLIEVQGELTGPATGPTIDATRIEVHPGRAHGRVMSTEAIGHTFDFLASEIDDPFGDGILPGRLTVELDPSCKFEGDAVTEGQFHFAFTQLIGPQQMNVEVFGIGTTTPNRVRAYRIKTNVQ